MKVTSCYNNSISRSELYAGHETEYLYYCDWAGTGLRPSRGTALSSVASMQNLCIRSIRIFIGHTYIYIHILSYTYMYTYIYRPVYVGRDKKEP